PFHTLRERTPNPSFPLHWAHLFTAAPFTLNSEKFGIFQHVDQLFRHRPTIEWPAFIGQLPPQIVQPTEIRGVNSEERILLDIVQVDHLKRRRYRAPPWRRPPITAALE